jgi:hypothetical protein
VHSHVYHTNRRTFPCNLRWRDAEASVEGSTPLSQGALVVFQVQEDYAPCAMLQCPHSPDTQNAIASLNLKKEANKILLGIVSEPIELTGEFKTHFWRRSNDLNVVIVVEPTL